MIKKVFQGVISQREQDRKAELYRNLIRREAKLGGELFGTVPKGHRREFFCLDRSTWVWHEEWTDNNKVKHTRTTRYDIRPNGILKSQNNGHYQQVSTEEARNFYEAVKIYRTRVKTELYNFV